MPYGMSFLRPRSLSPIDEEAIKSPYEQMMARAQMPSPDSYRMEAAPPENPLLAAYREIVQGQNGKTRGAYSNFLEAPPPQQENYKPSIGRRLAAALYGGLTGFSGRIDPEGSQAIKNRPYTNAMNKYGMEGARLKEAAGIEAADFTSRLNTVKSLSEMQNQAEDNERSEKLANSLIASRNITMEEAKQRIQNAGKTFQVDEGTGMLSIVGLDGSIKPVGKFKLSTGERIGEKKAESDITLGRERTMAGIRFGQDKEMEGIRDDNREQGAKNEYIRDVSRIGATAGLRSTDTDRELMAKNNNLVQATVDSNPARYRIIWDSTNKLLNYRYADTPEYKELYNILYNGVAQPQGPRNQILQ